MKLQSATVLNHLRISVHEHVPRAEWLRRGFNHVLNEEHLIEDPRRLLTTVMVSTVVMTSHRAPAQAFLPTAAPAQNWVSMTCSQDAGVLSAAGSYGFLWLSPDTGASWVVAHTAGAGAEPQRAWQAVAGSRDGSKLLAAATFNPIFVSTNYGQTWSPAGPAADWAAVASSADGTRMTAADNDIGGIYVSGDGGATWIRTAAPAKRWRCVSSSADGMRLAAGTDYGDQYGELPAIYFSVDGGKTWNLSDAPALPWQAINCSDDGMKLAAAVYGGLIYLSVDGGAHWSAANVPPSHWGGVASSADGATLVASSSEGLIYVSHDSGRTWTSGEAPAACWQSVACSADGSLAFAGIWNDWAGQAGGIYSAQLSQRAGAAGVLNSNSPVLNLGFQGPDAVLSWPASASGFTVQQNQDLASPNWTDVNVTPALVNGQNEIVVPALTGNHFFRLVKR